MTCKLLLALAMSVIVLGGCEDSTGSLQKLCASSDATVSQVQEFLDLGADVNARGEYGLTPLMNAALWKSNPEVISLLLKAGAEVNAKDEHGWTPLMWAVMSYENPGVISALLKAGAGVNAKTESGFTPLIGAAGLNSNPEVITVLLKAGADVNAKNNGGKTARDYAKDNEDIKGTQAMKELEEATNP